MFKVADWHLCCWHFRLWWSGFIQGQLAHGGSDLVADEVASLLIRGCAHHRQAAYQHGQRNCWTSDHDVFDPVSARSHHLIKPALAAHGASATEGASKLANPRNCIAAGRDRQDGRSLSCSVSCPSCGTLPGRPVRRSGPFRSSGLRGGRSGRPREYPSTGDRGAARRFAHALWQAPRGR